MRSEQAEAGERHPVNEFEKRLRDKIDWIARVAERLSFEDVQDTLARCRFLDDVPIGFDHMDAAIVEVPFAEPDPSDLHPGLSVDDNIALAIAERRLRLEKSGLTIIQADVSRLGLAMLRAGAMYTDTYDAIVIPESLPGRIRHFIRQELYTEVIYKEGSRKRTEVIGDRPARDAINGWETDAVDNPRSVFSLSPELIERYEGDLIAKVEHIAAMALTERIHSIHSLPHEAAHYFFSKHFSGEQYEGAGVVDLLTLGFEQMNARMISAQLPTWAQGIHDFFDGLPNLLDAAAIRQRCQELTQQYHLNTHQELQPIGVVKAMDEQTRLAYERRISLISFMDEYFARIYDAALGYTVDYDREKKQEVLKHAGLDPALVSQNTESFLNPTPAELDCIHQMSFQGRPIV